MTERISAEQFQQADGVADWRVLPSLEAGAHFRTGSFATGVALVDAIGRLADAANHHPDVDLRYPSVTVRVTTHDVGGLSDLDVALARDISAAARDLGAEADPTAVQLIQVTVDRAAAVVRPFWQAALGYREVGDYDLVDPTGSGPNFWFQPVQEQITRMHVDVFVPEDQAEARVAAVLAAGGRLVSDAQAPVWWTVADPAGNLADIATVHGRD